MFQSLPDRMGLALWLLLAESLLPCSAIGHASTSAPQPAVSQRVQLPVEAQEKLDKLQAALKAAQAAGDAKAEGDRLNEIGVTYYALGEKQEALEFFNQALPVKRAVGDRDGEAATLDEIAVVYSDLGEKQKALEFFNQALPIARAVGNRDGEARMLGTMGQIYSDLGEKRKALELFNQALPILRAVDDRGDEAATLRNIGHVYAALGDKQKALDFFNQALQIRRALGDRGSEAATLDDVGHVYYAMGEKPRALEFYNQALPILRAIGDRDGEAITLIDIGQVYSRLGEKQKALEFFNQAQPIYEEVDDHDGEATALANIGEAYADLGEKPKALDFYNRAQPIYEAVGDRDGEAAVLGEIGVVYSDLGKKQKALEFYNEALPLYQGVGDGRGEAIMLSDIGVLHLDLGETAKALEFFNRALPLYQAVGDRDSEGTALGDIGLAYSNLGEKQKALEFYGRALPVKRAVGDRDGEATALNDIARVYDDLGEKAKALESFKQALEIHQAVGDRAGEATTLSNIGCLYEGLGDKQRALDLLDQALPIATAVSDPLLVANILSGMMLDVQTQRPTLAIFYGKQAVNLLQQVRGNIQGLDKESQKSFLSSKEEYYRSLADLLIKQGRLSEALEVLDLLKLQEYSVYTRGEAASTLNAVTLTPNEQQAEEDYQKSTAQIIVVGQEWTDLRKNPARTPEQEARYRQVSDQIGAANAGLSDYFKRLYVVLGEGNDANKQVADVKGEVGELSQALAKMPRTVALYTLVGADRYRVVVITGTTRVAREYSITAVELNKKVAAFELVLRDRTSNPKPAAQELYNILIGPVIKDLDLMQAETLVWSLDGVLRYVPIAALYDGMHYVVERYNTVTITPESIPHLGEKPEVTSLTAAAMGISRQYEERLPALQSVVSELNDIVKDPRVPGADGVLPGTILLNDQFTEKAMEELLGAQHPVVHIASHFVFNPGDDGQSYLLLADETGKGFHLTVADFNDNPNLALTDTELLALSACETGMGGTASNGREVDGLGTTAQRKGAKAVISTLWPVDDTSTGQLMADFYGRWAGGGGKVDKVEALRRSQLDLLLSKNKKQAGSSERGFSAAAQPQSTQQGYAHPYYWAPFVLMGNWR